MRFEIALTAMRHGGKVTRWGKSAYLSLSHTTPQFIMQTILPDSCGPSEEMRIPYTPTHADMLTAQWELLAPSGPLTVHDACPILTANALTENACLLEALVASRAEDCPLADAPEKQTIDEWLVEYWLLAEMRENACHVAQKDSGT